MYTLFIDNHDAKVTIIIYKDGHILVQKILESQNKHSEITMPTLDSALKEANLDVNELNSVIVVNGPGSFTGERIAVTIAKTIAYCLNIPIRTLNSLVILSLNLDGNNKCVALEDRNGAFVGTFDQDNNLIEEIKYLNKSTYNEYKQAHNVTTECNIDYEKVYTYAMNLTPLNPHEVKPLYIKGISVLNDK